MVKRVVTYKDGGITGMALDSEVKDAIKKAVVQKNQGESLERRLISWLDDLSNGEIDKRDDSEHLNSAIRATIIDY